MFASLSSLLKSVNYKSRMLELIDILVEADKLVDFTRFFTHSGTKEVRSREVLRPLILLDLFGAEGFDARGRRADGTSASHRAEASIAPR